MEDKASRLLGVQEKEGCGIAASADAADVVNGAEKDRDKKRKREIDIERESTRKRMLSAQVGAKAIGKETIAFPIS